MSKKAISTLLVALAVVLAATAVFLHQNKKTEPFSTNDNPSPSKQGVTQETPEELMGKFASEKDPKDFFEFREDGTIHISQNAFSGYAEYDSKTIHTYFLCNENETIISFRIISGAYTFVGEDLSFEFRSDPNNQNVFIPTHSGYEDLPKYVKVS